MVYEVLSDGRVQLGILSKKQKVFSGVSSALMLKGRGHRHPCKCPGGSTEHSLGAEPLGTTELKQESPV